MKDKLLDSSVGDAGTQAPITNTTLCNIRLDGNHAREERLPTLPVCCSYSSTLAGSRL